MRVDTDRAQGFIVISGVDGDGRYEPALLPWQARQLAEALIERAHALQWGRTYELAWIHPRCQGCRRPSLEPCWSRLPPYSRF
jgi:hypothetical protein